jgi:hypothetical protein
MTFKVAYERYSSSWYESLKVLITNDCGSNWTELYSKSGSDLATGPDNTSEFIPSQESEWRTDTVDLSDYINQQVQIKIVSINGWGNNIYIDDINVDVNTSTQTVFKQNTKTEIYPNPAQDIIYVKKDFKNDEKIVVLDISGKILKTIYHESGDTENINIANLDAGVYFIKINEHTYKFIKK